MSDDEKNLHHGPMMSAEQDPQKNEYATPPEVWRPLSRCVGGFDVDSCSGAEPTPIAPTRYDKDDDGLTKKWHGDVFANIPWSSDGTASAKVEWLTKVREEARRDDVDSVVVLLPSDTSAGWFHEHVLPAELICFVGPGRISFLGEDRNPSFGLLIVVYGDDAHRYRDALDEFGAVVEGQTVVDDLPQTNLDAY